MLIFIYITSVQISVTGKHLSLTAFRSKAGPSISDGHELNLNSLIQIQTELCQREYINMIKLMSTIPYFSIL